jgi:hypothetical protein
MKILTYRFYALSFGAAAALVGCGGSTVPVVVPEGPAVVSSTRLSDPTLPAAKNAILLYATAPLSSPNKLYVFTYPDATFVNVIKVPHRPEGLCTDTAGDIFVTTMITNRGTSYVYEYAHGGTRPIATLSDPGGGNGCAFDPLTGNLAVANWFSGSASSDGNVAIYRSARGKPSTYTSTDISVYRWCAYDDKGNLFVDGVNASKTLPLVELPEGASSFKNVTLSKKIVPSSLQWLDGKLLVADATSSSGPEQIYRVKFSGSKGTVVGNTTLESRDGMNSWGGQFAISGTHVAGPSYPRRFFSVWSYPEGGPALRYVHRPHVPEFYGVAISTSP